MIKRLMAVILACLLLAGALQVALAEYDGFELATDAGLLLVGDAGDWETALPGQALSLPDPEDLDDAIVSNAADPAELSISKSVTKKVTVGTTWQIRIPGKTIKTCKSNNKKVATVTKKGIVKTLKTGTAKITVTPKKGSKLVLKLKVVGKKVALGVAINEGAEATLALGGKLQLSATVTPSTASQKVTWKSSDKGVATVSSKGLVKAKAVGKATISATSDNGLKAKLKLTVRKSASGNYMISHAMGGIDGYNYSNCLEGFLENYAEGHRIFEVDMEYTSDGKMVLWHDWDRQFCSKYKKGKTPTYAQFMKSRIFDAYTPMDIEALLRLMDEYPDVRIITDTKYTKSSTVKKQFKTIVSTAKKLGVSDVLDRLVVEIYTKDMFKAVESVHHFKEYMVTLYKAYSKAPSKSQLKSVAKFCKKNGIATVAMYAKWWKSKYAPILEEYGLDSALYTVNSKSEAKAFFKDGVTALFTDFLPPV